MVGKSAFLDPNNFQCAAKMAREFSEFHTDPKEQKPRHDLKKRRIESKREPLSSADDPSDASELALKIKQKGKLLVAYLGDGTFAWCGASKLKPFAESFKECSKMSNSRSFLGAVEEAVEEMGRHIERILVCDCAEDKDKFDSRVVDNAGIKEGVLAQDVRREIISPLLVGKHGEIEILDYVKAFAETVSFSGLLELDILKRKVSLSLVFLLGELY